VDPLTVYANLVVALLEFMTEVSRGQSAAQKEKLWSYYLEDVARWRKFFKLDQP
jgi:hypothetical protein